MILVNFEKLDGLRGPRRERIVLFKNKRKIADTDFVVNRKNFKGSLFLNNVKDKCLFHGICTV